MEGLLYTRSLHGHLFMMLNHNRRAPDRPTHRTQASLPTYNMMRTDLLVQTGPVPSKVPSAWHFCVISPLAWVYPSAHVYSTSVLKSTYSSDGLFVAWHTVVRHCTTVNTFNQIFFSITFNERFIFDVRYFLVNLGDTLRAVS